MNDRDAPSFHNDNPIANETAVLQFATRVSRLRHHYLGLDSERLRAGMVRGKGFALVGGKVRGAELSRSERRGSAGANEEHHCYH